MGEPKQHKSMMSEHLCTDNVTLKPPGEEKACPLDRETKNIAALLMTNT